MPDPINETPLTGHEYDGIQEYDNPTPSWWWWGFGLTALVAPIYFLVVLAAGGVLSPIGAYDREKTRIQAALFAEIGDLNPDAQTILFYKDQDEWMAVARNIFAGKCVQCHGAQGQGLSGPNLTDDHYLNVQTVEDLYDVIANGRNNNTMPAWKTQLSPNHLVLMTAYTASLRGQNLPGKPPEGQPAPPWPPSTPETVAP